jgi:hypothetical protein
MTAAGASPTDIESVGLRGHIREQGRWPPPRDAALIPEPILTTAAPAHETVPLFY